MKLRDDQERIASYTGGYMAVPAVPGAGKTFTLSELAVRLLANDNKKKILIVTCMNSAASNIKNRITKFLSDRGLPIKGFEVKTLHSLAVKILRFSAVSVKMDEEFTVIDEHVRDEIIMDKARKWINDNRAIYDSFLPINEKWSQKKVLEQRSRWEEDFLKFSCSSINSFKESRFTEERLRALFDNDPLYTAFIDIYSSYKRYQAKNNKVDFTDMIIKALELLESDKAVLAHFQDEWEYLFEDEAQDSSSLQQEILYHLSHGKGNLVRVGDLNQSIMGTFTLADPSLFSDYCSRSGTVKQPIYSSGRSGEPIYRLANELIRWTRDKLPEERCRDALEEQMIVPAPFWDKSSGREFANPESKECNVIYKMFLDKGQGHSAEEYEKYDGNETEKIAGYAANSIKRNPKGSVGIIVANNKEVREMTSVLDRMGVGYQEIGASVKEKKKVLKIIASIVKFLTEPDSSSNFLDALEKLGFLKKIIQGVGSEKRRDKIRKWIDNEVGMEQLFYPEESETLCPPFILSETWYEIHEGIRKLSSLLALNGADDADLIIQIGQQFDFSPEDFAIVQRIAYETRIQKRARPDWRISDLPDDLNNDKSYLTSFINEIYDRNGYEAKEGTITVCTCHKAKGLEWDTVFLMHIKESNYPSLCKNVYNRDCYYLEEKYRNPVAFIKGRLKYPDKNMEDILTMSREEVVREKARLLYVGITRAKKNICLSGSLNSGYMNWFKRHLG